MKNRKAISKNAGFSLIEIIIGLTIIGFIIATLLNIPSSIRLIGESHRQSIARDIAAKKIEDLRSLTYDNLANTDPSSPLSVVDSRLSELSQVQANYQISDCPTSVCTGNPAEAAKQVKVTITWKESEENKKVEISTLIAQGGLQ